MASSRHQLVCKALEYFVQIRGRPATLKELADATESTERRVYLALHDYGYIERVGPKTYKLRTSK